MAASAFAFFAVFYSSHGWRRSGDEEMGCFGTVNVDDSHRIHKLGLTIDPEVGVSGIAIIGSIGRGVFNSSNK